jgi:hypothetical protein
MSGGACVFSAQSCRERRSQLAHLNRAQQTFDAETDAASNLTEPGSIVNCAPTPQLRGRL